MTSPEAKEAFINGSPINYNGAKYNKIIVISFKRGKEDKIIEVATLQDRCKHSEITVPIKDISLWTT